MSSPYADLSRPPLRENTLRQALVRPGSPWTALRVVPETTSTNSDLVEAARSGAAHGSVLVAERQTAGRGRLDRRWQAPPQSSVTMSVLLRPGPAVPAARLGWLPLLAGVALVDAVNRLALVDAALKWPNDLLVRSGLAADEGYGKCAGILAELAGDAVVVGIGLNVTQRADELPPPVDPQAYPATSLALVGSACTDRDPLVRAVLRSLAQWYERWTDAGGDPDPSGLRAAYRQYCSSLGHRVVVLIPGDEVVEGTATDIDADGRLIVDTPAGSRLLAAGDVLRVR